MIPRAAILLSLIATIGYNAFGQETTKPSFRSGSYGALMGLNLYSNIEAASGYTHEYNSKRTGSLFGIEMMYRPSRRSAFSIGLLHSNVAYKANYSWTVQQSNDPELPVSSDIQLNYLDLPVRYCFSIISREKVTLYTNAGFAASFLSILRGSATYADGSVRGFESVNAFIPGVQLGTGIQYNVNKNLGFKIETNYRAFLKGFDKIMAQSPTALQGTIGLIANFDWECFTKKGSWKPLPICD